MPPSAQEDKEKLLAFIDEVFPVGYNSDTYEEVKTNENRCLLPITPWVEFQRDIVNQLTRLGFASLEEFSCVLASDVGMLLWVFVLGTNFRLPDRESHPWRYMSSSDAYAILDAVRKRHPSQKEASSLADLNVTFDCYSNLIINLTDALQSARRNAVQRDEMAIFCDNLADGFEGDREDGWTGSGIENALRVFGITSMEAMLNAENGLLSHNGKLWFLEKIGNGAGFKNEFLNELESFKIIITMGPHLKLNRVQQFEFWVEQRDITLKERS